MQKKKTMKRIDFTLPEITFFDGDSHKGNELEDRTVILHVPTLTILEVICLDEVKDLHLTCETFDFTYKNKFGIEEKFRFAVHRTFADDLQKVLKKCAVWYKNYLRWEDKNIRNEAQSAMN